LIKSKVNRTANRILKTYVALTPLSTFASSFIWGINTLFLLDAVSASPRLEQEFHCEMMGKPFIGRTLMGFDNVKQTFNTVWVSDMQTSMLTSEGKGENGKQSHHTGKATL